jgi:hypothetical protein
MTMLSPLKPLLCRHDFYWSERHRAERCRRCGKLGEAEAPVAAGPAPAERSETPVFGPAFEDVLDIPAFATPVEPVQVRRPAPSRKALKAQAQLRREALLGLLDRLSQGRQPTREEAIDAVLAVIEDAHSADPVLFGEAAAGHFARLHEARNNLIL